VICRNTKCAESEWIGSIDRPAIKRSLLRQAKLVHLAHVWFRGQGMNPTTPWLASGLASIPASVLVAGGGALGAWLRYMTMRAFAITMGASAAAFPWATLTGQCARQRGDGPARWLAGTARRRE